MSPTLLKDKKGLTIAETVMAVVVTLVAAVSLFQAFYYGMAYIERQAHRRLALTIANSEMEKWGLAFETRPFNEIRVPRRPVEVVIDERDPDTRRDDFKGYIRYSQPEILTETVDGQPVRNFCKFWVRVYWYEDPDDRLDDSMESVQLVSLFLIKQEG